MAALGRGRVTSSGYRASSVLACTAPQAKYPYAYAAWHYTPPTAATWIRRRCSCAARLPRSGAPGGWRLTFGGEGLGWDGALTTLVEDTAQRVFVALYDVPEVDEKELDSWDGVNLGFYSKIKVRVQTLDGDVLAWLYVLDAYEGGLPSDRRLSILVDSAIKAGAPADYIDWLRARPSNPPQ